MSEKVQSLLRNPPKYPKSCYEPCTRRCNDDCSVYTQHFVEWEQQIRAAIADEKADAVEIDELALKELFGNMGGLLVFGTLLANKSKWMKGGAK